MAKKKKKSNKIIYILGVLVVLLVIFVIVGKSQGWVGQGKKISVEIGESKRATIVEKVSASGQVQPVVEVKISSEVSGEIIELAVEEGDSVSKGDFLMKIRPDLFESDLERSEANLSQQRANEAQAKSSAARALANLERSKQDFNRQQGLFDQKVISLADFQLAEANYKIAEQDYESARQSVIAAEWIIKSAEATLRQSRENLRLTTLKAPMTGIVSKLSVELGETVLGTSQFQGTEVMRIADLSKMQVKVDVNENDIIRVSLDDTVSIDVDSYSYLDKTFKGIVTQIANTANDKISSDAVTEFEVEIKILNSSYQDLIKNKSTRYPFRPGMTASVEIITEVRENVLSLPLSSVTTRPKDGGGDKDKEQNVDEELLEVVFIYEDGVAVMKEVKTGISDFERIEITQGLEEGIQVVSGPFLAVSKRLEDGKEIEIQEEEEEASEEN